MASKIRVFISSTMKDLANERDAVVKKISDFNFEPLNAESWLPNGSKSWDRIKQELESSHIVILIVGERYGWIPEEGPGSVVGISVTHMEFNEARQLDLPILPFLKKLDYDSPRDSEDAKKRDAFRREIASWATGQFMTDFELAADLSHKVGASLVNVLSETYLKMEVRERAKRAIAIPEDDKKKQVTSPILGAELIAQVRERAAFLLAGAGMSLNAGYPSAGALAELLIEKMAEGSDRDLTSNMPGSFQDVAEIFESVFGREKLLKSILNALDSPQGVKPTIAHLLSINLFETIVTTNFDCLFEAACEEKGVPYTVVTADTEFTISNVGLTIIKIDGSISAPESLVLTTHDAYDAKVKRSALWDHISLLVKTRPAVIVGHSLRDINTKTLFYNGDAEIHKYMVAPDLDSLFELKYARNGFTTINSDADAFFQALTEAVEAIN